MNRYIIIAGVNGTGKSSLRGVLEGQEVLLGHIIDADAIAKMNNYDNIKAGKKAVEEMYNVTVVSVNTMNYRGKNKSRYTKTGLISGRTAAYKKALVTLKEGETIDFYSNI